MKKPDSLRAAIVAACPEFNQDPDRLKVFVDEGKLISRRSAALGFVYVYQVRIFVEAFAGSTNRIMVPLLLWIRGFQPDLFLRFGQDEQAVKFAADILDDGSWDLALTFELTEAVRLVERADGSGHDVTHLAEPSPDDPLLPGAVPTVPLREIWLDGQLLVPQPQ